MTIQQAITQVDTLKPNQYKDLNKIEWLSTLDGKIKSEIIDTHVGSEAYTFNGYNEDTNYETELIAKDPYSELYVKYLMAQIDFFNAEWGRYNNTSAAFNVAINEYSAYYNRNFLPLQKNYPKF